MARSLNYQHPKANHRIGPCKECRRQCWYQGKKLCRRCHEKNRPPPPLPVVLKVVVVPPTTFLPGSSEKMLVMRKRASVGLPLFNPKDVLPS